MAASMNTSTWTRKDFSGAPFLDKELQTTTDCRGTARSRKTNLSQELPSYWLSTECSALKPYTHNN